MINFNIEVADRRQLRLPRKTRAPQHAKRVLNIYANSEGSAKIAQSCQSFLCSKTQYIGHEEASDRQLEVLTGGYKTFFMLNSAENEICYAHKNKIPRVYTFYLHRRAQHEIFSANKYQNVNNCWHFNIY